MIDISLLRQLYPDADPEHEAAFAAQADALFARFAMAGAAIPFFLAQIGHETGGLSQFEENLSYRAARIAQVWPTRFASEAAARPYEGRPARLANRVYAGRMGNGNEESGDGYRYRGRGYLQLTGRDSYRGVARLAGLDLEARPDLVTHPDHALLVACAFWRMRALAELCNRGDFAGVCKRINGGTVGLAERRAWLARVAPLIAANVRSGDVATATRGCRGLDPGPRPAGSTG